MASEKTPEPSRPDDIIHDSDIQDAGSQENAAAKPLDAPPDGGLRAWLVAAGAASIFFCGLGFANSFGSFAQYYQTHQLSHLSEDTIAWIGSLSATLQFLTGLVGGPLFDRYGEKIIWPGCIVYLFGVMMLSLCHTYWQIMLVQGVLMGGVLGFLQFPAIAAVAQHFKKNRGAALGIAISGSSFGGVIIPIIVSKMLNGTNLGFGWTVRITGFVMIPFLIFAVCTVKSRVPPKSSAFFEMAALKDVRLVGLAVSIFFVFIGMFMPLFFLPTYATLIRHMDPTMAGYLLAVLNAASTFGRVIPGFLADKYGRFNIFCAGCFATGIVIFFMNFATTTAGIVVYSIVVGFVTGTIISGASTALASCAPSPQVMGSYSGIGMALGAFGGLIGPPLNGKFVSVYGGFLQSTMFSGTMCIVAGIVALATKSKTKEGLFGRA